MPQGKGGREELYAPVLLLFGVSFQVSPLVFLACPL